MSTLKVGTIQDHANSNTAINIDSSGRTTFPEIPCFQAHCTNNSYITTSPIIFDTEDVDRGGIYNNSTGVFTAPINGIYKIDVQIYLRTDNGEDSGARLQKSTNGGSNWSNIVYTYLYTTGVTQIHGVNTISQIMNLNANDQLRVVKLGSGDYYAGPQETFFMGHLIG